MRNPDAPLKTTAPDRLLDPRAFRAAACAAGATLLTLLLLLLCAPPLARAAGGISPAIERAVETGVVGPPSAGSSAGQAGRAPTRRLGAGPRIPVLPDGRIVVRVVVGPGADPSGWPALLPGCTVDGSAGSGVQACVPLDQVRPLAALPGVLYVGVPSRPVPLIQSQALPEMRVPEYWRAFGQGADVRIGVIDLGFAGYTGLLGTELPSGVVARSFTSDGDITGHGEIHGTACAEIVHDVAPDAEMYLANVDSDVDLARAAQWMVDQGVEVISHSVGWFEGPGDGTGAVDDVVHATRQAGVLWVNASGNFGYSHWAGPWRDRNNNGIADIDTTTGNERIRLEPPSPDLTLVLLWDLWPTSRNLDFQFDLMNEAGEVVARSDDFYAGDPFAYRSISYQPGRQDSVYTVRIRLVNAAGVDPTQHRLQFFRADMGRLAPENQVIAGSLAMPADSPDAISVGAFRWNGGLEPYSSQGPNAAGLPKPDILGPDAVSTASYGVGEIFAGTSAAAPHVAGALGLLLGGSVHGAFFDARWPLGEVVRLLQAEADTLPGLSRNAQGAGRVRLPVARLGSSSAPQLVALAAPGNGGVRLRLVRARTGMAPALRVFDVTGRLLGLVPGARAVDGGVDFSGLERILPVQGRFWALEPASGARVAFYWPGKVR